MKRLITIILLAYTHSLYAQAGAIDSAGTNDEAIVSPGGPAIPFQLSAYAEIYFGYDGGQPADHTRPGFVYSHNRHNELNLNLGFLKASYGTAKLRANLALMAGTYTNANLGSEPAGLRNVFEANAGVRLSRKYNLWVDVGIMPSHIGFESAVGKDCWTLTRSIIADNSPYYEAGVKLNYTSRNEKWYLALLYLNGWQRIQRVAGNQTPAFGTQVTYKPGKKLTINSSSFIGSDKPDASRQLRCFHNVYAVLQPAARVGLILDFDYGFEQASKYSSRYDSWYGWAAIAHFQLGRQLYGAARAEYFHDPYGIIISWGTPHPFRCSGYSLNLDYGLLTNALIRIEGKWLSSPEKIFMDRNVPVATNLIVTAALAVSL